MLSELLENEVLSVAFYGKETDWNSVFGVCVCVCVSVFQCLGDIQYTPTVCIRSIVHGANCRVNMMELKAAQ